jgi:hypothetical protein
MNVRVTNFNLVIGTVTPVLDTNAYAAGDTLFATTAVTLVDNPQPRGTRGIVRWAQILDKDDVGEACTLYFLKDNVTFGTANSTPSISDANAENIIGFVELSATKDLGGCRFGQAECYIPFSVTGGTIYVAAVTTTALTHAASGVVLRMAFEISEG